MNDKPTPPEDWECCESECSPCVWDSYYEELRAWKVQQRALQDAVKSDSASENKDEKH